MLSFWCIPITAAQELENKLSSVCCLVGNHSTLKVYKFTLERLDWNISKGMWSCTGALSLNL